jgi:CDP-diacylglycerol--glycerol-3-phosphate 3-phosphatidyltransferase
MMNKATGLLLFLWPLTVPLAEWKFMAIVVCFIAALAALQEGVYVLTDREPGRA